MFASGSKETMPEGTGESFQHGIHRNQYVDDKSKIHSNNKFGLAYENGSPK